MIHKRKSYSIEEQMSGDWIEIWSGFRSLKRARAQIRRIDGQYYGKLRIVRVLRTPLV